MASIEPAFTHAVAQAPLPPHTNVRVAQGAIHVGSHLLTSFTHFVLFAHARGGVEVGGKLGFEEFEVAVEAAGVGLVLAAEVEKPVLGRHTLVLEEAQGLAQVLLIVLILRRLISVRY